MSTTFTPVRYEEPRTFSWPRFKRLARAHWAEQRPQYLAHLLVVGLLYAVLLLFMLGVSGFSAFQTGVQSTCYLGGLYLTGFVFAGRYFAAMAQRESALLALMRPASVLEKWLLCVLVVAIAYPVAYSLLYLAISWPVQQVVLAVRAAMEQHAFSAEDYALFVPFVKGAADARALGVSEQLGYLISIWALQAFAVAGSLYFVRASMLKTLVLGVGLFVLTALLCAVSGARVEVVFAWWSHRAASRDLGVHVLNALLWIGLPALLWGQAYVHLQEKELM